MKTKSLFPHPFFNQKIFTALIMILRPTTNHSNKISDTKKPHRLFGMALSTFLVVPASAVSGATYYISTSGNDANTCTAAQSSATSKSSFTSAWGCIAAGDTLIVKDGTYTKASPPAGKAGSSTNIIKVKAENDGGVTISDGLALYGNSYLEFEGFKFISKSGSSLQVVSNGSGAVSHHITFRRNGFTTIDPIEYGGVSFSDGTHHVLMEDFWIWGGGRYAFMCYGGTGGTPPNTTCDYNTFRRGVVRQGPATSAPGNPQAGFALYTASNNIVENVIVLDSIPSSDTSNAGFYLATHECCVNNNKFYGVIALNNLGVGWYIDHNGIGSNNELRNSVVWDSSNIGVNLYTATYTATTCSANIVDHVTVGVAKTRETFLNFCSQTTIKSSILTNATTYGASNDATITGDYNLFYNNKSGNYRNMIAGTSDIKDSDPQLAYILRTEAGTLCKGKGENGSDCGATVINRYQDGSLTSTHLWPWPNEDRIKKDMCTDAGVTRGFCSKASLTEYIWTYLGNPVPSNFGEGIDSPVTIPLNLRKL